MKRVLIVMLLLVVPISGCSSVKLLAGRLKPLMRPVRPLFQRKVDPHSSPDALMDAYRKYAKSGKTEKLWTLYSEQMQQKTPQGLFLLQESFDRDPISEIHIGNPIVLCEDYALYYNIVTFKSGDSTVERAELTEESGKWFINHLGAEKN